MLPGHLRFPHGSSQERSKREPAWLTTGKQGATIKPDTAKGKTCARVIRDPTLLKPEISPRVVTRIVDQYQMSQSGQNGRQLGKRIIGPDVTVHHQERIGMDQPKRMEDPATGFEPCWTFRGIGDTHPKAPTISKRRDQLIAKVCMINHDVAYPRARERLEEIGNQRSTGHGQQRLRDSIRQWPHSLAAPGGKNHG